ncbi:hypothetical protein MJ560_25445 [Klebsiella pneumoniae]|nr:hypothetical protein MJ560_25445 [Klebsiella pneumoniae]
MSKPIFHDEVEAKEVEDRESLDTVDALEQKEMPDELPLSMPAGMKSIPGWHAVG